jgi:glycosyltransferase involved in cell wall biosynthesis
MKKNLISIITVCYNSEKTIRRTLESVLAQTYDNFEYIIIDGASTDGTLSIVEQYKDKFSGKIQILSEPDNGIYNAMNKGIQLATGDVIGILNSDDWFEPDTLEQVCKAMQNVADPLGTLYCGWLNFHYADGTFQILKTSADRFARLLKRYEMGLRHPATFVPLKVYQNIGVFDESLKISSDTDFIIRCARAGCKFEYIDSVLSNMSDDGVSNTRDGDQRRIEDRKKIYAKYCSNNFEYFCLYGYYLFRLYVKPIMRGSLLKWMRTLKI